MNARVAVIIVNWNGKRDTLECLHSLRRDTYGRKDIFVIDNGSSDDSLAAVSSEFPEVTLIAASRNLGFTGGNNLGIARALEQEYEFVYLLNNDTVSDPQAITTLVQEAERRTDYGLLVPLIVYHDAPTEPWFAGSKMNLAMGTAVHANCEGNVNHASVVQIDWATGCALLMPASAARILKGFDDRFFLNWEDVDLSVRARDAGYKIGLVPAAKISHKVSRSLNTIKLQGLYYSIRNNLLFIRKHSGAWKRRATMSVFVSRARECARAFRRKEPTAMAQLVMTGRAFWDHWRGRYGPYSP